MHIKSQLSTLCVLLFAGLRLSVFAETVQLRVASIEKTRVVLAGECRCSPGTLVAVAPRSHPEQQIVLRISRHVEKVGFVASPVEANIDLSVLQEGDVCVTDSPISAYLPLDVSVVPASSGLVDEAAGLIRLIDPVQVSPDATVDYTGATLMIDGPFGQTKYRSSTASQVRDAVRKEAEAFQLFSLTNNYLEGDKRSRLELLNRSDFSQDGKLRMGKPILLSVTPALDGYCALLMFDTKGRVTVLYPNDVSQPDRRLAATTTYGFSDWKLGTLKKFGIAKIDIDATSAGPTAFLVIVSSKSRPLSSFIRSREALTFVDMDGNSLDPTKVGPGWSGAGSSDDVGVVSVDDLDPQTWDSAHLKFLVTAD